jgi:citrate lyase synthetase
VVRELAPPIVLARSGALGGSKVLLPAISSTDVRARVAAGAWSELEDLVPRSVLAHIRSRSLYGSQISARGPGLSP